jgi:hypothetical protein
MSVASRARRASTVFAIPENAHTDLVMLRDHVHLMVELIDTGSDDSQPDVRRCSEVMTRHLSRVAKQIDEIVAVTTFSTQLSNEYNAAHRRRKLRYAAKT